MLPEQQQRILGYFIEEAKDHLNTIEQGLLNLQSTLDDPEMVNEVFRAAHSIKGGAAMLGLSSIQRTSHRLEDFFKLLKEHPVMVDQKLESLFLGVLDTLKALLEHLQGPFGLTEETANTLMSETEPVFGWLHEHLELLVQKGTSNSAIKATAIPQVSTLTPQRAISVEQLQVQVLQSLREMLQLFKQQATPDTRQSLQACCHKLAKLGDESGWSHWCHVCRTAEAAIANPENTYLSLAKIVITEIKQALELIVSNRETEIAVSEQLRSLVGVQEEIELLEIPLDLFGEYTGIPTQSFDKSDDIPEPILSTSQFDLTSTDEAIPQEIEDSIEYMEVEPEDSISSLSDLNGQFYTNFDNSSLSSSSLDTNGPEVGIAELNTLADLFEGETPELDDTWDKEEIIDLPSDTQGIDLSTINTDDTDSEFEFLFDGEILDERRNTKHPQEELTLVQLFGDAFVEEENIEARHQENSGLSLEFTTDNREEQLSKYPSQQLTDISDKVEDKVSSLSDLVLDENESLSVSEITPVQTETIPNIELSTHQEVSFNELFLEPTNLTLQEDNLVVEEEQEVIRPQSESFNLEELFTPVEEDPQLTVSENKPTSGDLLDTLPASNELRDFFWEPELTEEENIELDSLIEEEAAKELEEILFAATSADDIFGDSDPSLTSTIESLTLEELDYNFQTEEQQFNIFSSENDDDLFEELTATESTISSPTNTSEVSPKEIRSYTQKPEALEVTPEFASLSETSPISSSEFDIDLFEGEDNDVLSFEFELMPTNIYNNFDSPKTPQEGIVRDSSEVLDVEAHLQIIDIEAQTISREEFDFTEISLGENDLSIKTEESQVEAAEETEGSNTVDDIFTENFDEERLTILSSLEELTEESELLEIPLSDLSNLSALFSGKETEETTLISAKNPDNLKEVAEQETPIESKNIDDLSDLFAGLEIENDTFISTVNQESFQYEFADLSEILADRELEKNTITNTEVKKGEELAEERGEELSDVQESDFSELIVDGEDGELEEDVSCLSPVTNELKDLAEESQQEDVQADELSELLADLELENASVVSSATAETSKIGLTSEESTAEIDVSFDDEFAELDKLLTEELAADLTAIQTSEPAVTAPNDKVANSVPQVTSVTARGEIEIQFQELEEMVKGDFPPRPSISRAPRFEQLMKVPVKHLDDMSNLVGELVVNRNTLEQDQERLRQFLDNLLHQVQQLSDVGARMQELYERSLLEASLLASRRNTGSSHQNTDRGFSELEMDRFTPFHSLSQEMIELIVRVREAASDIDFVTEETERVARQFRQVTNQLQEGITRARMEPFSEVTTPLERGVRESAIKEGKQAQLKIEGRDTLIDKMILGHLKDPLTHLLNNAIAHGIEPAQTRQSIGKPPIGNITVRAFHQGNQTVISVSDDGAGIDAEKVKAKAIKTGLMTAEQAKTMSRLDVYDLLFQPGFSTKDKENELAGRGVGLDVVRTRISEIRGTISIDSNISKGTTFTIRLPLTLSICKALCCVSERSRIAFPMDGVEDTLDVSVKSVQHGPDGQKYILWRDTVLPFRPLKEILTFNRQLSRGNVYGGNRDDDMISVVVVRSANTLVALQIDQVLNEQEIVIKQFEGPAPKPIGIAGATVLGDGRIMPIADVLEIVDIFQGRTSKQRSVSLWEQKGTPTVPDTSAVKIDPTVLIVDDSITVRELLSLTFNKAGYRVEQARDGQEAWDKLRSGLPCDIVFCDIEMPRCDGLELLSRIQKDSSLNHLPIAMLTSRGADKHRQMAVQLGASGYFTKPYLEEALLEAASRMLKGEKLVS
jgi:chemotaxis protein histidine kinase CheA/ActR/RegA family two-component response regulator